MERIIDFFKKKIDYLISLVQIFFRAEEHYKYKVDHIELKNEGNRLFSIINYRIIGCRTLTRETAQNLNKSTIFSLFRPDHAQVIVSLATVESILNKTNQEITDLYMKYFNICKIKINEKSN